MSYDNTNTGALFKAKERATDKHPEYSGTINVDGKEYWLAGWVNEAKSGQKYFSLKVKPKDKPADKSQREERAPKHFEDMASDLPF